MALRLSQKRNIWIGETRTSVTLEDCFWDGLQEIAADRQLTVHELAEQISDSSLNKGNLSGAIREFLFSECWRQRRKAA